MERNSSGRRQQLRPNPLTLLVVGLVVWNAFVLWLVYTGATDHSVGNDAAGMGMSRGFRELFAMAGGIGIGVLTLPYLFIRHHGIRVALAVMLGIASFLTPLML